MSLDAIQTDANDTSDDAEFDGEDAFLTNLTAAENLRKPSKGTEEGTETEETEDAPPEEPEEQTEEQEEPAEDDDKTAVELGDDTKIAVKVDGKDLMLSLGELKRLAGQEQALTRKSMEVAEARKGFETTTQKAATALTKMLERAQERFKPYAELDYLKLSRNLDESSWDQLRKDALTAQADVEFFKSELDANVKSVTETNQAASHAQAVAAVATLSGPVDKGGIAGWNQQVYNDVVNYAVAQGLPQQLAYAIVEPAAIRMLHKAMQFDRGKTAATTQIVKAKVSATKVHRPGSGSAASGKSADAMSRLSRSGSDDDAVDAFMAGLK